MVLNGVASSMILFTAAGAAGAQLRPGTASRWALVREEVHRRHGWYPEITSAGDGFRSYARQEELFRRNYTTTNTGYGPVKSWGGSLWYRKTAGTPSAAVPGKSNHGYGTTADVVNVGTLNQFGTARYNQFADVATEFGFSNAEGGSIGEPWHWSDTFDPDVITTGGGSPAPPTQEDDTMTPEQFSAIITRLDQIVSMASQIYARDGEIAADVVLAKDNAYNGRVLGVENQNALNALLARPAGGTADVDESALAAALAPLLALLPDADVERIAAAVCDEQSTRLAQ